MKFVHRCDIYFYHVFEENFKETFKNMESLEEIFLKLFKFQIFDKIFHNFGKFINLR